MAVAKCWPNAITLVTSGFTEGTEAAFLAKETPFPTVPTLNPVWEGGGGKGSKITVTKWRGVPTFKKVLAVTFRAYWSQTTPRVFIYKLGSEASSEKELGEGWTAEVKLTKAVAEALTKKGLEELVASIEQAKAAIGKLSEIELEVEYEPEEEATSNPMVMMV